MLQKKKKFPIIALSIAGMGTMDVQAGSVSVSPHELTIGVIGNYYQYDEKVSGSFFMDLKGYLIGAAIAYQYTTQGHYVFGMDMDFSDGHADYSSKSTGKAFDEKQNKFESRLKVGKNFFPAKDLILTPYVGFGVRVKSDYGGDQNSTTGAIGYDRRSTYLYIPVGLKLKMHYNTDWAFETFGEVDIFLQGKNYSDSTVLGPSVTHTQKNGYGLKAGFETIKFLRNKHAIAFGPYVNFWHIKDSDKVVTREYNGTLVSSMEPDNKTLEAGLAVRYRF